MIPARCFDLDEPVGLCMLKDHFQFEHPLPSEMLRSLQVFKQQAIFVA